MGFEHVPPWQQRVLVLCNDGQGNVDPLKYLAFRDQLTGREFLAIEEAHIVFTDHRIAVEEHEMRQAMRGPGHDVTPSSMRGEEVIEVGFDDDEEGEGDPMARADQAFAETPDPD